MRTSNYPEYPALMLAAKQIGRAVRWRSTRQEGFVSDNQARDTLIEAALALDGEGRFLALDIDVLAASAPTRPRMARLSPRSISPAACRACTTFRRWAALPLPLHQHGADRALSRRRAARGGLRARTAGRRGARVTGIDRIAIRRRNLIGPADAVQDRGRHHLRQRRFPGRVRRRAGPRRCRRVTARKAASEAAGKKRGLGVACFLEIAGGQPGEGAAMSFPGQSKLLLAIGVQASGQGHRTVYRRLVAERLGISVDRVDFTIGDSDREVPSAGAVASRSTMSVGGAVAGAIDQIIEKGRRIAAHVLEAAEEDIQYRDGVFEIAGTDRNIALFELAERAATLGDSLDTRSTYDAAPSFPNGVHIAEVEVDPDSGASHWRLTSASTIAAGCLQPVLVEGQVQGGVAQGAGQALLEWGNYDDDSGQLVAGS